MDFLVTIIESTQKLQESLCFQQKNSNMPILPMAAIRYGQTYEPTLIIGILFFKNVNTFNNNEQHKHDLMRTVGTKIIQTKFPLTQTFYLLYAKTIFEKINQSKIIFKQSERARKRFKI